MLSSSEDDGMVRVCALLSIAAGGTAIANPITVELATSDDIPGECAWLVSEVLVNWHI